MPRRSLVVLAMACMGTAAGMAGKAKPRLLGDMGCAEEGCEDVQVSPDGRQAVWADKHHLWLAPVAAPAADGAAGSRDAKASGGAVTSGGAPASGGRAGGA